MNSGRRPGDPVAIVRGRGAEDQYVNDRPYVAASLLSLVLTRWFNSVLGGRCERKTKEVSVRIDSPAGCLDHRVETVGAAEIRQLMQLRLIGDAPPG